MVWVWRASPCLLLLIIGTYSLEETAKLQLTNARDKPLTVKEAPKSYSRKSDHNTAILVTPQITRATVPVYRLDCQGTTCSKTIRVPQFARSALMARNSGGEKSAAWEVRWNRYLKSLVNSLKEKKIASRSLAVEDDSQDNTTSTTQVAGTISTDEEGEPKIIKDVNINPSNLTVQLENTNLTIVVNKDDEANSTYDPFKYQVVEGEDGRKWPTSYLNAWQNDDPYQVNRRPSYYQPNKYGNNNNNNDGNNKGEWVSLDPVPYSSSKVSKWVPKFDYYNDRFDTVQKPSYDRYKDRPFNRPNYQWWNKGEYASASRPTQHWNYDPPSPASGIYDTASSQFSNSWNKRPYNKGTVDKVTSVSYPSQWDKKPSPSWDNPTPSYSSWNKFGSSGSSRPSNGWMNKPSFYDSSTRPDWPARPETAWDSTALSTRPYGQYGLSDSRPSDWNRPSSGVSTFWTRPDYITGDEPQHHSHRPGYTQIETDDEGKKWVLLSRTSGINTQPSRVFSERSLGPSKSKSLASKSLAKSKIGFNDRSMSARASVKLTVLPQIGVNEAEDFPVDFPADYPNDNPLALQGPTPWNNKPGFITPISKPNWSNLPYPSPPSSKPTKYSILHNGVPWPYQSTQALPPDYFEKLNATLQTLRPVKNKKKNQQLKNKNKKKRPFDFSILSTSFRERMGLPKIEEEAKKE